MGNHRPVPSREAEPTPGIGYSYESYDTISPRHLLVPIPRVHHQHKFVNKTIAHYWTVHTQTDLCGRNRLQQHVRDATKNIPQEPSKSKAASLGGCNCL